MSKIVIAVSVAFLGFKNIENRKIAMNKNDLISKHPNLWHMTEQGSWPSICKRGLLSTSYLLDLYKIDGKEREKLETAHRPEIVEISCNGLPNAIIRDQKSMSDAVLKKILLDDITPSEWYSMLNARIFLWLSSKQLEKLRDAKAYRDKTQTVLTLDSKSLIDAYETTIELSPINSGSTLSRVKRGYNTFLPIEQYDYDHWRRVRRPANEAVVEFVIMGGIPDVAKYVLAVHEVTGKKTNELWRRQVSTCI